MSHTLYPCTLYLVPLYPVPCTPVPCTLVLCLIPVPLYSLPCTLYPRDVTLQRGTAQVGYKSTAGRGAEHTPGEDSTSLTPWLRPTLFAYLNFSGEEHAPPAVPAKSERLIPVPVEHWPRPAFAQYARICLIAPMSRMIKAFGEPTGDDAELDDEDEDARFAQWCFALVTPPPHHGSSNNSSSNSSSSGNGNGSSNGSSNDSSNGSLSAPTTQLASGVVVVVPSHPSQTPSPSAPVGSVRELPGAGPGDEPLYLKIKGCGEDTTGISALVGYSTLNMLIQQPDVYSIRPPPVRADSPVLWHIEHQAGSTEVLVAFLERHMPGVHFLVHYDAPNVVTEEDDLDLLYISRSLCVHPLVGTGLQDDGDEPLAPLPASPGRRVAGAASSAPSPTAAGKGESSGDSKRDDDAVTSGGALLGVDLEALTRLVLVSELDDDDEVVCRPFFRDGLALSKYVRPLDRRLRQFRLTDRDEVDTVLEEYLIAASEAAAEGVSGAGGGFLSDADREAEQVQRAAHAAALETEYLQARVTIVDLGNACWTHKHFTDDIQTRQYRAPEVLLGASYDTSADMWSLACIVFELVTGDLLFDPQEGKSWDREEDHLAMMIELVGDFPRSMTTVNASGAGKHAGEYFNRKGELKHIHNLKYWGLRDVLRDKYKLTDKDAMELAAFVTPLLAVDPAQRATAEEALKHPWLQGLQAVQSGRRGEAKADAKQSRPTLSSSSSSSVSVSVSVSVSSKGCKEGSVGPANTHSHPSDEKYGASDSVRSNTSSRAEGKHSDSKDDL